MPTKIDSGGGYQQGYDDGYQAAEVYDGYTLFMCLIGKKWGAKKGDEDNDKRCRLAHIDMTRVKSLNITLPGTNWYDYIDVKADSDGSQIFHRQVSHDGLPFDIDFSAVAYEKKKQVTFEWYSWGEAYLQINSVTKAE